MITLGIIGVVAALTMPSVINNVQKIVLKNQFKTAYSIISNAVSRASYDLGYVPACHGWVQSRHNPTCSQKNEAGACVSYTTSDGEPLPSDTWGDTSECNIFWPQFKKSLSVVKDCNKNALSNGCIPNYKGIDQVNQESYNKKPGEEGYIDNYGELLAVGSCGTYKKKQIDSSSAFVLNNGIIIFNYSGYKMDIDVNGKKGPNKWGYDLYSIRLDNEANGPIKILRSECTTVEKGGISGTSMIQNISK